MTQFQQQSPQKKVIHVAGAESCSTSEQAVNNEVHSSAPDMTADLCNNHQAASSVYSQPSLEHLRSTHALNQFRTLPTRRSDGTLILSYRKREMHTRKITRTPGKHLLLGLYYMFCILRSQWTHH